MRYLQMTGETLLERLQDSEHRNIPIAGERCYLSLWGEVSTRV